jgi:hypothetical protein
MSKKFSGLTRRVNAFLYEQEVSEELSHILDEANDHGGDAADTIIELILSETNEIDDEFNDLTSEEYNDLLEEDTEEEYEEDEDEEINEDDLSSDLDELESDLIEENHTFTTTFSKKNDPYDFEIMSL